MKKEFHSNGKLLISGEYLVLQGALSLATPVRYGQKMIVQEEPSGENILHWKNYDHQNNIWADVQFSKSDLLPFRETLKSVEPEVYETLQRILHTCRIMQPAFLKNGGTTIIENYLEFDRNWGLGSSSTLINNLASYAHINAFDLNTSVFDGSGYDIACARSGQPILFRIDNEGPIFDTVNFSPPQRENLFFVYLGNKQDTKLEVEQFKASEKSFTEEIEIISEITEALLFCDEFADFIQLLDEHEEVMQFVLQRERVQSRLFPDFKGVVKSLGAWGGDFVLAASEQDPALSAAYFRNKMFDIVIPYDQMIRDIQIPV